MQMKKGISLVVLVIMIIVTIILAGTIILSISEQNIILQAINAKEKFNDAVQKEQEILDADIATDYSYAGTKYKKDTTLIINGRQLVVPAGATVSNVSGEYENVNRGVVIYMGIDDPSTIDWTADVDEDGYLDVQEEYDQFIWVPVETAVARDMNADGVLDSTDIDLMTTQQIPEYPMAIAANTTDSKGKTVTNYRGILYNFSAINGSDGNVTGVSITDKDWEETSTSNREPAYLGDRDSVEENNNVSPAVTQELLQKEYNVMVENVNKNKGFWVGRYETSNMVADNAQDLTNRIRVIRGTTDGIIGMPWYRMYTQQKNYSTLALTSSKLSSTMIWGSQWDQIMIWMKDVKNEFKSSYYIISSIGMANYGAINGVDDGTPSGMAATGNSDVAKVKNIYDMAGNVRDWTLEASGTTTRVRRGGTYGATSSGATQVSGRGNDDITTGTHCGSRLTIY